MRGAIIGFAFALAGCAGSPQAEWNPPAAPLGQKIQLQPENIANVENAVRIKLKDPDSAQFRNIMAAKADSGTVHVCGEVNSKNSFGGYTGFSLFYGTTEPGGAFRVLSIGGESNTTSFTISACTNAGVI